MNKIHILFPVLNEERRLERGIEQTVAFMEERFPGRYIITIVDNGSEDRTFELAEEFSARYPSVFVLHLEERGVGVALRRGVEANNCEIVGYMDIDLSTGLHYLLEMDQAFKDTSVQIVNASRLSKGSKIIGRSKFRLLTSYGLKYILKFFFHIKFDDAVCGFKFFRKEAIEQLIIQTKPTLGWFFCIELLIRAEKTGKKIKEIPVVWEDDDDTTVKVGRTVSTYLQNIFRLWKDLYIHEGKK